MSRGVKGTPTRLTMLHRTWRRYRESNPALMIDSQVSCRQTLSPLKLCADSHGAALCGLNLVGKAGFEPAVSSFRKKRELQTSLLPDKLSRFPRRCLEVFGPLGTRPCARWTICTILARRWAKLFSNRIRLQRLESLRFVCLSSLSPS